MIVSHARDFLNVTCDEIIHFFDSELVYYRGNFDTYLALDFFFRVGFPSDIPLSNPPSSRLDTDADSTEAS